MPRSFHDASADLARSRQVGSPYTSVLLSLVLLAPLTVGAAACGGMGGGDTVPRPGMSFGGIPPLQGQQVMVLPVQIRRGLAASAEPDREIAFALEQRGPRIQWLFPDTLRRITGRSPGIVAPLEGLPVGMFLQAQVERVGDPLYGHLRRLSGLTGAPLALIPVRLRYRAQPMTVEEQVFEPAMEISAALIHVRSGRVLWFGILDGSTGGPDDPATLASTADMLARVVAR